MKTREELVAEIKKAHADFVNEHGIEPQFAIVEATWNEDCEGEIETIKLRDYDKENTENDPDDDYVTYYADGIEELCQIVTDDIADFKITHLYEFTNVI